MPSLLPDLPCRLRTGYWPCLLMGLLTLLGGTAAAESPGLLLRTSPGLQESISAAQRRQLPTLLFSDWLGGRAELDLLLLGRVELRRGDTVLRADRLEYDLERDRVHALGQVRINQAGNRYVGPELELKVDAFEGFFLQPQYQFAGNQAHGQASRVEFLDDKRSVIRDANFTTCRREAGPNWLPDWLLQAKTLRIDAEDQVGQAEQARLEFKGQTLLSLPTISFSLSDRRKSGMLAPTFGVDNVSGTEVTVPYYWDIAPNRDATLYPTLMSKRGLNLGGEFRYLESSYGGRLRADYMPGDALRGKDRWGAAFAHQGVLDSGLSSVGTLGLNLNLNRVSDDDYWRDFPRGTTSLTQRLLPNDAQLSWTRGPLSAQLRALKWQTLQDASAPITPPYDRLPQLTARYVRYAAGGFDFSLDADLTQFQSDRLLTGQPNAQRGVLLGQISRPWLSAAGFLTPKLQLHTTAYQFDAPLALSGDSATSRAVPTFSLDGGLVFERQTGYLGRDFVQTLEPRLFYVHTPFRQQNHLPNYDSAANDFNFASIYSENAFVGHDRIADNNLLTAGVTTRLLDPRTGAESARFGVAQRLRLSDQNVTLPGGSPAQERLSDLLLGAAFNWDTRWVLDSVMQFNPTNEKSVRSTVGARYSPGHYRVLNVAYRFQRDLSEQVDVGWQWPLNDLWGDKGQDLGAGQGQGPGRWYGVGRLNYSLREAKLVDSIVGFEYDAGCWLGRVVLERLQTGLVSANQRLMFQLELVGFSRLGIDPLNTLKNNIPRYQLLRSGGATPSRFSDYD